MITPSEIQFPVVAGSGQEELRFYTSPTSPESLIPLQLELQQIKRIINDSKRELPRVEGRT